MEERQNRDGLFPYHSPYVHIKVSILSLFFYTALQSVFYCEDSDSSHKDLHNILPEGGPDLLFPHFPALFPTKVLFPEIVKEHRSSLLLYSGRIPWTLFHLPALRGPLSAKAFFFLFFWSPFLRFPPKMIRYPISDNFIGVFFFFITVLSTYCFFFEIPLSIFNHRR